MVLGVDQTGAKDRFGGVKPLPTSLVYKKGKAWKLVSPLMLKSLNKESVQDLLTDLGIVVEWDSVLVVADCVLGLPNKIIKNQNPLTFIRSLMVKANKFEGVGLKAAEKFFNKTLPDALELEVVDLLREQEKILGCLSVFKNKPFQRNVQTGTYRIWSDLGKDKAYLHFNIWPYEKSSHNAYLCEGYPAQAKKVIETFKTVKIKDFSLYKDVSKDHKDAASLAVLGLLYFDEKVVIKYQKEGFIFTGANL